MSQRSLTLQMAPKFMKTLLVLGTAAMFLVGGGIPVHGIGPAAEALHYAEELAHAIPTANGFAAVLAGVLVNGLFGLVAGGLLVAAGGLVKRLLPRRPAGPETTWVRSLSAGFVLTPRSWLPAQSARGSITSSRPSESRAVPRGASGSRVR